MRIFFIIAEVIILLFGIIAISAPKEFKIEREITINKPKGQVFDHLRFLRNHDKWNAWSKKDPKMKKEFKGTDGTIGFTSSWVSESDEVGTAEQEIKSIAEGQRLDTQIRFKKPFEGAFSSYVTTESVGTTQTKVVIGMYDAIPFPMTVISFIVNDCLGNKKKIAKNMDESLGNLKSLLERQ